MKRKLHLFIALGLALLVSSGTFVSTITTASNALPIALPGANVVTVNQSASQPDWSPILADLASSNKTAGEVPSGNLFTIQPVATFSGDLMAKIYLANTGNLSRAYSYLNAKVYMANTLEAGQTPNYRLITLKNGEASFIIDSVSPTSGSFTQTSQADFNGGTLNNVNTSVSPGDVLLNTLSSSVTDNFTDTSKIASSTNVTVSGGQVQLDIAAGGGSQTIRPIGVGTNTVIPEQFPTTGAHWDKVDEVTADNDTTYLASNLGTYSTDTFNTSNPTPIGSVDSVTVYIVARAIDPQQPSARPVLYIGGTIYDGTNVQLTTSYAAYSTVWNTNPNTGNPWEWSEVNSLEIGAAIQRAKNGGQAATRYTYLTQVFAVVSYSAYRTSGQVSSINLLSANQSISIDSFDYAASSIPVGTSMEVQFSTDNSSWYNSSGTLGGTDTLSTGSNTINLSGLGWSGNSFYYRVYLYSDGSATPVLDLARVNYTIYYASGDLISSSYDTGLDLAWDWGTISFTVSEPASTDVKFQIRTASTEGGLSSAPWYGPTGTGDYYQTSGSLVNSVHDGDRWIQYRAYLTGPSNDTPVFSDIIITFSAAEAVYTLQLIGGAYSLVSDNSSEWDAGWSTVPEFFCEVTPR